MHHLNLEMWKTATWYIISCTLRHKQYFIISVCSNVFYFDSHLVASQESSGERTIADRHLTAGFHRKWKQKWKEKPCILLTKKRYATSQIWRGKCLLLFVENTDPAPAETVGVVNIQSVLGSFQQQLRKYCFLFSFHLAWSWLFDWLFHINGHFKLNSFFPFAWDKQEKHFLKCLQHSLIGNPSVYHTVWFPISSQFHSALTISYAFNL